MGGGGQSWGCLRRDEEGRVWWEGEGMRYGVVGKVEGRGEVLRLCSLILQFCIASACEHWPKYISIGTCMHAV